MSQKERDAFVAGAEWGDRNYVGNHDQAIAESLRRYRKDEDVDETPAQSSADGGLRAVLQEVERFLGPYADGGNSYGDMYEKVKNALAAEKAAPVQPAGLREALERIRKMAESLQEAGGSTLVVASQLKARLDGFVMTIKDECESALTPPALEEAVRDPEGESR